MYWKWIDYDISIWNKLSSVLHEQNRCDCYNSNVFNLKFIVYISNQKLWPPIIASNWPNMGAKLRAKRNFHCNALKTTVLKSCSTQYSKMNFYVLQWLGKCSVFCLIINSLKMDSIARYPISSFKFVFCMLIRHKHFLTKTCS